MSLEAAKKLHGFMTALGVKARVVEHVGEVLVESLERVKEPERIMILRYLKSQGLDRDTSRDDPITNPQPFEIRTKGPTWTQWVFRYLSRRK